MGDAETGIVFFKGLLGLVVLIVLYRTLRNG